MDKSKIRLCKKPHLHFLASNFLSFVFLTGHEGILFLREGLRIIPSVAGFSSPPTFCQQVPISVLCYHLRAFYSLLILYRTIGQDWYSKNNKKYTFSLIEALHIWYQLLLYWNIHYFNGGQYVIDWVHVSRASLHVTRCERPWRWFTSMYIFGVHREAW